MLSPKAVIRAEGREEWRDEGVEEGRNNMF